jgi:polysaccharide biosynthesis transport protein
MQDPVVDPFSAGDAEPRVRVERDQTRRQAKPRLAASSTPPAALSMTPTLIGLLSALRRRWLLAVTLGLLIAPAVAFGVWTLRPITFTARSLLHVNSAPYRVLFDIPDGKGDFSNYQRLTIAMVRSRLVLNSALNDPKVAELDIVQQQEEPVSWLEKEIHADFSVAPEVLTISMTGETKAILRVIVDAVRKAYMVEIVQKENKARHERLGKLSKIFAEHDNSLTQKRDMLKKMALSVGGTDKKFLAARQELSDMFLNRMKTDLLKNRTELNQAQMDLDMETVREKENADAPEPDAKMEEYFKQDLVVKGLQSEIGKLEEALTITKSRAVDVESETRPILRNIENATKRLTDRRTQLRPRIIQMRKLDAQARVNFLTKLDKRLYEELERASEKAENFKVGVVDLVWLQEDIAQLGIVQKEVTRQKQALEVEIDAPARVTQLEDEVSVLPAQTESSRMRLAGGVGLGTFAAILLGIALLEFRLRRVNSAEEVVDGLKMRLVGSLPLVPRRALLGRSTESRNAHWQKRLTESIDAIRTTLLNAARFDGLRVVMVTSAVGGEGKTLLSCHLAVSLARAGCRTLLVDGDLRRPSVHKLFSAMPLARGLSELLRGEAEPYDVALPGPIEGLSVITAGQSDGQAVQALARDRMADVLRQLGDYEFIVIDSAPVLPVADAQLIGQHVDGVVFSVMRDVSRLPAVYAACERLSLLRIRILGAVVNGINVNSYRTLYYEEAPKPTHTHA